MLGLPGSERLSAGQVLVQPMALGLEGMPLGGNRNPEDWRGRAWPQPQSTSPWEGGRSWGELIVLKFVVRGAREPGCVPSNPSPEGLAAEGPSASPRGW